ncbi:MAG: tRNA pseudouridine(38-40) synthase TruA, partial [Rhodobacteraceae bacterium]|nr:tRNA pseudouridine(38-40) synthase TruA [Paracoccaceae bacterium]
MNRDKDFHRFALCVEYCGSEFSGWQRQRNAPSVQQTLETALSELDPGRPTVTGAGRTDSGVHATGQVAHVDLERRWDPFRLREAANAKLRPASIAVLKVSEVDRQFSARTSAVMREYRYKITNRRAPRAV